MDEWTEYAVYARELGFTAAAPISAAQCQCSPQLRALCTPDQCTAYGTSWVCPPGCGEFSECAARLAAYTRGLVIQTKYEHVTSATTVASRFSWFARAINVSATWGSTTMAIRS